MSEREARSLQSEYVQWRRQQGFEPGTGQRALIQRLQDIAAEECGGGLLGLVEVMAINKAIMAEEQNRT